MMSNCIITVSVFLGIIGQADYSKLQDIKPTQFAKAPGYSEGPTWKNGELFFCSGSLLRVSKDGKVEPRVLQTNRTVGSNWLVTAGLNDGDQLIVEGLQKVRPGAVVQAVPATSTAVTSAAATSDSKGSAQAAPAAAR